jgi:hypothetical protein
VLIDVFDEVVPDLLLTGGEQRAPPVSAAGWSNVCSPSG